MGSNSLRTVKHTIIIFCIKHQNMNSAVQNMNCTRHKDDKPVKFNVGSIMSCSKHKRRDANPPGNPQMSKSILTLHEMKIWKFGLYNIVNLTTFCCCCCFLSPRFVEFSRNNLLLKWNLLDQPHFAALCILVTQ
jgi:hypothetical protein